MEVCIDKSITFCCKDMFSHFAENYMYVPEWNATRQNYIMSEVKYPGDQYGIEYRFCPFCGEKITTYAEDDRP